MRRRHFVTLTVTSLSGLALGAPRKLRVPLRFFTEQEAGIVSAATARIFPSDPSSPGAVEAGVVVYIDRQLAGPYGRDRYRYTQPPFERGLPEQGYQGAANPRQIYRAGLAKLAGLDKLPPPVQDTKLREIENT